MEYIIEQTTKTHDHSTFFYCREPPAVRPIYSLSQHGGSHNMADLTTWRSSQICPVISLFFFLPASLFSPTRCNSGDHSNMHVQGGKLCRPGTNFQPIPSLDVCHPQNQPITYVHVPFPLYISLCFIPNKRDLIRILSCLHSFSSPAPTSSHRPLESAPTGSDKWRPTLTGPRDEVRADAEKPGQVPQAISLGGRDPSHQLGRWRPSKDCLSSEDCLG
nr:uncharacterized protein LOC131277940 [Dasypus novemcinctus]